jgi:HD-GYP domain-containing protein (c-di-GMP phosphodiesterase class II)
VVLVDPQLEERLTAFRKRGLRNPVGREAAVRVVLALLFIVAMVAFVVAAGTDRHPDWWLYPAFLIGYAFAASIPFEVGVATALPTEVVFVPMLFVLPARFVPVVVVGGLWLVALRKVLQGRLSWRRALVGPPVTSLFALGPAVVMLAAGEPNAGSRGVLVLAAALAAQFVVDGAIALLLEWGAYRVSPRELVKPLGWTFAVDALLGAVGYVAAIGARVELGALLLPVPLIALLALFSRERTQRLDSMLELSSAYRGTALLLGDVVEADDAYTGQHSRHVVDLVLEVANRLGLDPETRRLAEFAAMLHDVGKIRIPATIIDKPGPLSPEEREVMNTHTVEGETLLLRVGGLLADVGRVVRSCHERWDGTGYPDGLSGEQTPLVSRIICCCDAYDAMTTDRPYRRALPHEAALAELRTNRGTQFDPQIVDALLEVLADPAHQTSTVRSAALPIFAR